MNDKKEVNDKHTDDTSDIELVTPGIAQSVYVRHTEPSGFDAMDEKRKNIKMGIDGLVPKIVNMINDKRMKQAISFYNKRKELCDIVVQFKIMQVELDSVQYTVKLDEIRENFWRLHNKWRNDREKFEKYVTKLEECKKRQENFDREKRKELAYWEGNIGKQEEVINQPRLNYFKNHEHKQKLSVITKCSVKVLNSMNLATEEKTFEEYVDKIYK